ncbi:MAG: hypothetical protein ACI85S_002506, partial [Pseudohongiellaceae bacterium]
SGWQINPLYAGASTGRHRRFNPSRKFLMTF